MNSRSIRIDQIHVRLRGVSPEAARLAVSRLGPELLARLACERGAWPAPAPERIASVQASAASVSRSATPEQLRTAAVESCVSAVRTALEGRAGESNRTASQGSNQ